MTAVTPSVYTREEVSRHASKGDAWIVISDKIYNISSFNHPGLDLTVRRAGKDVTELFTTRHGLEPEKLKKLQEFFIGYISSASNNK